MGFHTANTTYHQVAIRPIEHEVHGMKSDSRASQNFNTAMSSNKQGSQKIQAMKPKTEKTLFDDELKKCMEATIKEKKQPLKKKKISLQEYRLRIGASSNNNSPQVSPEAKFPDTPSRELEKCLTTRTLPIRLLSHADKVNNEPTFFDPIKEAARKILMKSKKPTAEAIRKRDENIVMSKITKVDSLQLQPLMSDAEMIKIVGITQPKVIRVLSKNEKPKFSTDHSQLIPIPKNKNCYTALIDNKQNVQILKTMESKAEKRLRECVGASTKQEEQPQKKKKISFHEYQLRHSISSNSSSAQSSPEVIFPDMPVKNCSQCIQSVCIYPLNSEPRIFSESIFHNI